MPWHVYPFPPEANNDEASIPLTACYRLGVSATPAGFHGRILPLDEESRTLRLVPDDRVRRTPQKNYGRSVFRLLAGLDRM